MTLKICFVLLISGLVLADVDRLSKEASDREDDFPDFPSFEEFLSDNFWPSESDFSDEIAEASFHNYERHYGTGSPLPEKNYNRETFFSLRCTGNNRKCFRESSENKENPYSDNRMVSSNIRLEPFSLFPPPRKGKILDLPSRNNRGSHGYRQSKSVQNSFRKNYRKIVNNNNGNRYGSSYVRFDKDKQYESSSSETVDRPVVSRLGSRSKSIYVGLHKWPKEENKGKTRTRDFENREGRILPNSRREVYFKPIINVRTEKLEEKTEEKGKTGRRSPDHCIGSKECSELEDLSTEDLQYYKQDQQGPGSYKFGYSHPEGKDVHYRREQRDSTGHVTGSYGYRLPDGQRRLVKYWVDKSGNFRQKTLIL